MNSRMMTSLGKKNAMAARMQGMGGGYQVEFGFGV